MLLKIKRETNGVKSGVKRVLRRGVARELREEGCGYFCMREIQWRHRRGKEGEMKGRVIWLWVAACIHTIKVK